MALTIEVETILWEVKWKLINLEEYYHINCDASVEWYKMACEVYLFFRGKLPSPTFKYDRNFYKVLYQEYPYAYVILHDDRVFYQPNTGYLEITPKMRWAEIYKGLCLYNMRLLYEEWEKPKGVQLELL